jgi:hypothetical protein
MFSTIWEICFSLNANPNEMKTSYSCTVRAQSFSRFAPWRFSFTPLRFHQTLERDFGIGCPQSSHDETVDIEMGDLEVCPSSLVP